MSLFHLWVCLSKLVIVMFLEHYSRVGQWIVFPPWQLAWHLPVPYELVLGEDFQVSSSPIHPTPVSNMNSACSNGNFTFKFWEAPKGSGNSLFCFGGVFDSFDQQVVSHTWIGCFCSTVYDFGGENCPPSS